MLPAPGAASETYRGRPDNIHLNSDIITPAPGACFAYEERDGFLTVTGLRSAGLERTTLTVPSAWEGKPVSAIGPNAFSGTKSMKEIIIQPNICTTSDGAFSGCAALERIVIQSVQPAACRVGQVLLEDTEARVYVPREALSAYRIGYFWSMYGASLLPQE